MTEQPFDFTPAEHHAVLGFRGLDQAGLAALAANLRLTMPPADLLAAATYFSKVERRDPTVGELHFLNARCRHQFSLAENVTVAGLSFTEENDRRIFADLCRQRQTVKKDAPYPPTLTELATLCGKYLDRAGRVAAAFPFTMGSAAEAALLCNESGPILSFGDVACYVPCDVTPADLSVLLLCPVTALDDVMTAASTLPLLPLAVIGEEGLYERLLEKNIGAEIDLGALQAAVDDPAPAKNTALFCLPEEALSPLLEQGLPLLPIGRCSTNGRLLLREGLSTLLHVSLSFLGQFRRPVAKHLALPAREAASAPEVHITEKEDLLFGGMRARSGALQGLVGLVRDLFLSGADLHEIRLEATLILPDVTERMLSLALPLLLDLHRVAAELSLPVSDCKLLTDPLAEAPALAIFAAARKADVPPAEVREALLEATGTGDFPKMRKILY